MITYLIPIGEIPFFVNANLANITDSCGVNLEAVDFVFLTSKDISSELEAAFESAALKYRFRVLKAPFNVTGTDCHLKLLDWAFTEGDLQDWVFIQHADVFWNLGSNWLIDVLAEIEERASNIALVEDSGGARFAVDSIPILRTQGYAAAFNRELFVEHGLTFSTGIIGSEVPISPELEEAISAGRVEWTKLRRSAADPKSIKVTTGVDRTDGADIISLEIAVRFPKKISTLPFEGCINHLWHFFDMYYDISRQGDTLVVDRSVKMAEVGMHYYAWVSSFLFDKDVFADKILPWQLQTQYEIGARDDFNPSICDMLKTYTDVTNVVGNDNNGIKFVKFTDDTLVLE